MTSPGSTAFQTRSPKPDVFGFHLQSISPGSKRCMNGLYQSVVLPHLDYCSCVWDPPHETQLRKLESVQSFAAKITTGNWADSSRELKSQLHWPSLASRRLFQKLCMCKHISVAPHYHQIYFWSIPDPLGHTRTTIHFTIHMCIHHTTGLLFFIQM